MFLILRKFIVILLTLLQCIAPLVHAHASEHGDSRQGFHVPGFEQYGDQTKMHMAQIKKVQNNASLEGLIVAVDIGHKQNPTNPPIDLDNDYFLHQQTAVFVPAVSSLITSFSTLPQQPIFSFFSSSPPARAPPER